MTRGKQARGWAPYEPGNQLAMKHRCGEAGEEHLAAVEVRRCENVVGHDVGAYRWRVVAVRCDGTLLMIAVDRNGFDQGGRITSGGAEVVGDEPESEQG